jgi:hypothetical protein
LHITWHDPRKEELVEDEAGIHLPRVEVRAGILHEGEDRLDDRIFYRSGCQKGKN